MRFGEQGQRERRERITEWVMEIHRYHGRQETDGMEIWDVRLRCMVYIRGLDLAMWSIPGTG